MPREVLTQEEIDLLLKDLASGEVKAEEALNNEFFSEEEIDALLQRAQSLTSEAGSAAVGEERTT